MFHVYLKRKYIVELLGTGFYTCQLGQFVNHVAYCFVCVRNCSIGYWERCAKNAHYHCGFVPFVFVLFTGALTNKMEIREEFKA